MIVLLVLLLFACRDNEQYASAFSSSSSSDLHGDQGTNVKLAEIKKSSQMSSRSSDFMDDQVSQRLLLDRNQISLIAVILAMLLNMSQYYWTLPGEQLGFFCT